METLKPLRVPSSTPEGSRLHRRARSRAACGSGTMLVRAGLLSAEQLEEALAEKAETGKRLGEIVVDRGWVPSAGPRDGLAEQHHVEFVDLIKTEIEDAAASLLPERLARRYRAVPIRFIDEDKVLVAVADPTDVLASDDLRLALGMNIEFAVADQHDLERTLGKLYRVEFHSTPRTAPPRTRTRSPTSATWPRPARPRSSSSTRCSRARSRRKPPTSTSSQARRSSSSAPASTASRAS